MALIGLAGIAIGSETVESSDFLLKRSDSKNIYHYSPSHALWLNLLFERNRKLKERKHLLLNLCSMYTDGSATCSMGSRLSLSSVQAPCVHQSDPLPVSAGGQNYTPAHRHDDACEFDNHAVGD